jgi:hypothetical protein
VCVARARALFSVPREGGLLVLKSLLADKGELFIALNGVDEDARHIPAECKDVLAKATDLLTDPAVHPAIIARAQHALHDTTTHSSNVCYVGGDFLGESEEDGDASDALSDSMARGGRPTSHCNTQAGLADAPQLQSQSILQGSMGETWQDR